jgi:hypothetical protein
MGEIPSITGGASSAGATNGNFQVGDFGGMAGFPPPPNGLNDMLPVLLIAGLAWLVLKK